MPPLQNIIRRTKKIIIKPTGTLTIQMPIFTREINPSPLRYQLPPNKLK